MSIVMRRRPRFTDVMDGAVYGSYGETSGEAGDPVQHFVYETTVRSSKQTRAG
jgi:hypothetical protein